LVSVGEVEIDEAGEQGEYDNVQKEIANKPFTVFAFYVSLLYLSQFSFQPSGGNGPFLLCLEAPIPSLHFLHQHA